MSQQSIYITQTLEKFRKQTTQIKFPPIYLQDLKLYNNIYKNINDGFNCYAYAMQFKLDLLGEDYQWYMPGFLSTGVAQDFYNRESLIQALKNDCQFLRLNCIETTLEGPLEPDSYRIGVLLENDPFPDFHFIRQNQDNSWSEKQGWEGQIRRLTDITATRYELIKIMKISKQK